MSFRPATRAAGYKLSRIKGERDEQDEKDRFGNPVLKTITVVLRASDINVGRLNCNVFPFFIID